VSPFRTIALLVFTQLFVPIFSWAADAKKAHEDRRCLTAIEETTRAIFEQRSGGHYTVGFSFDDKKDRQAQFYDRPGALLPMDLIASRLRTVFSPSMRFFQSEQNVSNPLEPFFVPDGDGHTRSQTFYGRLALLQKNHPNLFEGGWKILTEALGRAPTKSEWALWMGAIEVAFRNSSGSLQLARDLELIRMLVLDPRMDKGSFLKWMIQATTAPKENQQMNLVNEIVSVANYLDRHKECCPNLYLVLSTEYSEGSAPLLNPSFDFRTYSSKAAYEGSGMPRWIEVKEVEKFMHPTDLTGVVRSMISKLTRPATYQTPLGSFPFRLEQLSGPKVLSILVPWPQKGDVMVDRRATLRRTLDFNGWITDEALDKEGNVRNTVRTNLILAWAEHLQTMKGTEAIFEFRLETLDGRDIALIIRNFDGTVYIRGPQLRAIIVPGAGTQILEGATP